jgi:hypothetical protein
MLLLRYRLDERGDIFVTVPSESNFEQAYKVRCCRNVGSYELLTQWHTPRHAGGTYVGQWPEAGLHACNLQFTDGWNNHTAVWQPKSLYVQETRVTKYYIKHVWKGYILWGHKLFKCVIDYFVPLIRIDVYLLLIFYEYNYYCDSNLTSCITEHINRVADTFLVLYYI